MEFCKCAILITHNYDQAVNKNIVREQQVDRNVVTVIRVPVVVGTCRYYHTFTCNSLLGDCQFHLKNRLYLMRERGNLNSSVFVHKQSLELFCCQH